MSDAANVYPQYHHMNAGAHRRPPPQIGAPALTWQRGFWMPQREAGRWDEAKPQETPWKQSVDNTLAHLFRCILKASHVRDCTSPNYDAERDVLYLFHHKVAGLKQDNFELEVLRPPEKSVRHVVFTARARFCGLWLTMSARLHHENFVILFALDFSGDLDESMAEADELVEMSESFFKLQDLIIRRHDDQRKPQAHTDPCDHTHKQDREVSEKLSRQLIADFRGFVDKVTSGACEEPCNDLPSRLSSFEDPFSDFVGIIYSLHVDSDGKLSDACQPEDKGFLRMSARVVGSDLHGRIGLAVLDAAWPVVTAADFKSDLDRAHGDPEYVVAAFNGGHTLYISSLGRLSSGIRKRDLVPLVYTLIVSYSSPWRLGRFVDKLNTVGTLRLAALRDLEKINEASNQIDRLSHQLASSEGSDGHPAIPPDIDVEFAKIGSELESGLAYRIERSRYYVNSYKDTVSTLRPQRIEGYQFYVDFVRSRVFDAFDYVDRVGKKYESLKQEIEFRTNLLRRKEARDLLLATARQARAAASLLEAAEILSVLPLTYYAAHLLMEVARLLREYGGLAWLPTDSGAYYGLGFVASVMLAYSSHALRRRREAARKRVALIDQI